MKININSQLFNEFLKKFKINKTKELIDKICSFGYEITCDNTFTILLPQTQHEYILGPITLAYIFTNIEYKDIKTINTSCYKIKNTNINDKIQIEKYSEQATTIKEFIINEFGSLIIPKYLISILLFFKQNGLNIDIIQTEQIYSLRVSIYRRLQLAYNQYSIKINLLKNPKHICQSNLIAEYLCNRGYKEICLHPITNYSEIDSNLIHLTNIHNQIDGFMNRNYIRSYLIYMYATDFDKHYFSFDMVFSIDEIYNLQTFTHNTHILLISKHFLKELSPINEIKDILLLCGKQANIYLQLNTHGTIHSICINNQQIGIYGFYKQRLFIEINYNAIKQIQNICKIELAYDYNICCKKNNLHYIIEAICKGCTSIMYYNIVDIYIIKDIQIYKYTVKFFLSEKINYNNIEDIIHKNQKDYNTT